MSMDHLTRQMAVFKERLEEFAVKHKSQINKNPEFRSKFQSMTASIGVDPLASNKGFWADVLGVGNFYFELGVQIVDVCMSTRSANGGLIDMQDLLRRLKLMRGSRASAISSDDVERAIRKLAVLGNGFSLISVGPRKLVMSVPYEMGRDSEVVLAAAQETGYVTLTKMQAVERWDEARFRRTMTTLIREGMCWIDKQASETQYWFPSCWQKGE